MPTRHDATLEERQDVTALQLTADDHLAVCMPGSCESWDEARSFGNGAKLLSWRAARAGQFRHPQQ
jgi:hypothetical protein